MKKPNRLEVLKWFTAICIWDAVFFMIYIIPPIRESLLGSFSTASRYSAVKLIEHLLTTQGWVSALFGFLNSQTNGKLYYNGALGLMEIAAWIILTALAAYTLAFLVANRRQTIP
ncbi:MAG: hypothetical protein ACYC1U_10080 [Candidatus Aquicultorales bacterium]